MASVKDRIPQYTNHQILQAEKRYAHEVILCVHSVFTNERQKVTLFIRVIEYFLCSS